jgi:1,4-alpha-glucan branching enzyme
MAEESTAWPAVTKPTDVGGLGFTMKWNMGWMHDTLAYLGHDAIHRKYHHDLLSFGPIYAFTENFISPLSHDEVVHGKGSLLGKMSGDDWQQFANLRLLYTFQWTYPGKKLLFMGSEFAQREEWDSNRAIRWDLLDEAWHAGIRRLVEDLNRLYRSRPALHRSDFDSRGFVWLRWDDRENSVLSFVRRSGDAQLVVVLNFTPIPREGYRIGVPERGAYRELINTDSRFYRGTDVGNPSPTCSEPTPWMNQPFSMPVTLPPLAGIVFERE